MENYLPGFDFVSLFLNFCSLLDHPENHPSHLNQAMVCLPLKSGVLTTVLYKVKTKIMIDDEMTQTFSICLLTQ